MNKIVKKIQDDAENILFDIRHQMAILGRISMDIETLMCNAYKLEQDYNEESFNELIYYYEKSSDAESMLDEMISEFDDDMEDLHKHMGELSDKKFGRTIDENYFIKEEKSDKITDERSLI